MMRVRLVLAASLTAASCSRESAAPPVSRDMVLARGWGEGEYACLYNLWQRESNWNVYSHNTSSGAYGIPQALPGEKM